MTRLSSKERLSENPAGMLKLAIVIGTQAPLLSFGIKAIAEKITTNTITKTTLEDLTTSSGIALIGVMLLGIVSCFDKITQLPLQK